MSFPLLLKFASKKSVEGIHLYTRSDWHIVQSGRAESEDQCLNSPHNGMLLADSAALSSQTEEELQRFSLICREFGQTISIKKTSVMGQDVPSSQEIHTFGNEELEATDRFTYLSSTITGKLSLVAELVNRIAISSHRHG